MQLSCIIHADQGARKEIVMGATSLFLEGPIGIGKTSLLMRCMGVLRMTAGGFIVRRLLTEDGRVRGFSLASPGASDKVSLPFSRDASNIFIEHSDSGSVRRPEVLEEGMLSLLAGAEKRSLVVLDEIGGVELLIPRVMARLCEVLDSGTPCAGVFKSRENARGMAAGLGLPGEYFDRYEALRGRLTCDFGARLIAVDARPGETETEAVTSFMRPLLALSGKAAG